MGILVLQTCPLSVTWHVAEEGFPCCATVPRALLSDEPHHHHPK